MWCQGLPAKRAYMTIFLNNEQNNINMIFLAFFLNVYSPLFFCDIVKIKRVLH